MASTAVIVDEEVNRQRLVEDRNYELKLQQGKINLEIAKVFNNKTSKDDLKATTAIVSNNEYMKLTTQPNTNMALSNTRIKVHEKKQEDVNVALLMILCLAEAFILFSLLSKYIFKENADKNLLVFNSVKEELTDMISSFWETTTKDFIKNSLDELNQLKAQNQVKSPIPIVASPNTSYPQTNPKLLGNYSSYLNRYNGFVNNNEKSPQYNGINANLYPTSLRTSTENLPTVYGVKEELYSGQIYGRTSEKKSNKQPFEIKEIFDENNDKWLYYKNWMVEENSCSEGSISSRVGSPLANGFTQNDLKVKEIKTFELPIPIDSDEHKKIWIIKIEETNRQYSNKDFVEAEMVEEVEVNSAETVEAFNQKVPAIDLTMFTPNEQRFLKELFDNGAITVGQNLVSRRVVLKQVGVMIKKQHTLALLYEKLYEQGLVEKKNVNPNNKLFKYIACAELHHEEWQTK